jgi:hypothetical protein
MVMTMERDRDPDGAKREREREFHRVVLVPPSPYLLFISSHMRLQTYE